MFKFFVFFTLGGLGAFVFAQTAKDDGFVIMLGRICLVFFVVGVLGLIVSGINWLIQFFRYRLENRRIMDRMLDPKELPPSKQWWNKAL